MARYGFRKMTMDDLAREAGLSKRTIYLHFTSKEDVGLSSIGRVVESVHRRLASVAGEDCPAQDRLRRMLIERVMGRVESVQQYHHSLDELFEVVRPAYMARRKLYFDIEVAMISEVLADLDPVDVQEKATALLLATNAFLPYSLSVRELGEPEEIRRRLTTMVNLLLRGLQETRG